MGFGYRLHVRGAVREEATLTPGIWPEERGGQHYCVHVGEGRAESGSVLDLSHLRGRAGPWP